ncbi:MAG: hypothetical protein K2G12_03610 [Prevotella sp.]|nr:hypothetical protein [Prevotella sp.]
MVKEKGCSDFNFALRNTSYSLDIEIDENGSGCTSISLQSFSGGMEKFADVRIPILRSQVQLPTEENTRMTISSTDGSGAEFKIILPSAPETVFTEPLWFYLSDGETQYLCQTEYAPTVLTWIVDWNNFRIEDLKSMKEIPGMTNNGLLELLFDKIVKNHFTDPDYFGLPISEGDHSSPTIVTDNLRLVKDAVTNDMVILAELNAFHLRGKEIKMSGSVSVEGIHQDVFETTFTPQDEHAWMINERLVIPDKSIRKFKNGDAEVAVAFVIDGMNILNGGAARWPTVTFYKDDDGWR